VFEFSPKIFETQITLSATNNIHGELSGQMNAIQTAIQEMPAPPQDLLQKAYALQRRLNVMSLQLNGDATRRRREFEAPSSINDRLGYAQGVMWGTTSAPTQSAIDNYNIAAKQFKPALSELKAIDAEVRELGRQLEVKGAPATPGRWPSWE
jgi:hypothetical protein